ncbi:hypothetical protein PAUR_a2340 [Pseudoalteromonas aurantia 208]|uniref:Uncharacterized protein n=2 Tax=Pseudoalteromonas aurantia TaxID=43654 RepID=A0ABR9ECH8_9GAMM|nr:hypothetical protein [Pseudoalteromonas aurantia 208]
MLVGEPEYLNTEITEKRISRGKSTSYILAIAPAEYGMLDLNVGEKFWNSQAVGNELMIEVQENIFGLYVVTDYTYEPSPIK